MDASSYDAYKTLVAQGKLGKLQRQVIVKLMEAGPQTRPTIASTSAAMIDGRT